MLPGLAIQAPSFDSAIGAERENKSDMDITGLMRLVFPVSRCLYKLADGLMKKSTYARHWWTDRNALRSPSEAGQ